MKRDSNATRIRRRVWVPARGTCPQAPVGGAQTRCFFSPKTKQRDPVLSGSWSGRWRRCDSRHVHFCRNPRPPLTERDAILVADFVNTTGDPAFDGRYGTGPGDSAGTVTVSQSRPARRRVFRDTLRYMSRSPDERVTDTLAREICQRENIKAVLGGLIFDGGEPDLRGGAERGQLCHWRVHRARTA